MSHLLFLEIGPQNIYFARATNYCASNYACAQGGLESMAAVLSSDGDSEEAVELSATEITQQAPSAKPATTLLDYFRPLPTGQSAPA